MAIGSLISVLALVGAVIVVSALLSGFVDKTRFPQVAIFLALGLLIGPHGIGMLDVGLDSGILQAVATLGLVLVLFTDALTLDLVEVRKHGSLAAIILGPGTLIAAALTAGAAVWLLGVPLPLAAMLGAALASTDPVLLRAFLRMPSLPRQARQALRLESGLNDVVLLPVVILAMTFATQSSGGSEAVGLLLAKMLLLGPAAGVGVALAGIYLLEKMRKHHGIRRDYESLYSIGIALLAYGLAEAFHASGYIAAFAAGITIAAMNVELCECFREYGETTAEMLLLLTFVLLGSSLIWTGLAGLTPALIGFAVLALAIRPVTLYASLALTKIDRRSLGTIAWFGPRGLSSLLLILLPIFAGTPGADSLFSICSLVVLMSIVLHGGSIMVYGGSAKRARIELPQVVNAGAAPEKVSALELKRRMELGEPVVLLDVRSVDAFLSSEEEVVGALRIDPQQARSGVREAEVPKDAWAALFCT